MTRHERHRAHRAGWLRAAVLGANDGIVSTASLIIGVAAAHADTAQVMLAGGAGLVAGAMSMAAGEYVSVSSQSDTEAADLQQERESLRDNPEFETVELAEIYRQRGVEPALARQVAEQLMATDALGAHARDEIGITELGRARPLQAAISSAASFAAGAGLPLAIAWLSPPGQVVAAVGGSSLLLLAALGALAARAGGAPVAPASLRVAVWGALAMLLTAAVGSLFGVAV